MFRRVLEVNDDLEQRMRLREEDLICLGTINKELEMMSEVKYRGWRVVCGEYGRFEEELMALNGFR